MEVRWFIAKNLHHFFEQQKLLFQKTWKHQVNKEIKRANEPTRNGTSGIHSGCWNGNDFFGVCELNVNFGDPSYP